MTYEILIGDRTVAYELIRKNVKNVNMRIYPDGSIKISASRRVPRETVEAFIRSRSSFVFGAIDKYNSAEKNAPGERVLNDGEMITLFDDTLVLRVMKGSANVARVENQALLLIVKDTEDRGIKERTLDAFLRVELEARMNRLLPELCRTFDKELDPPKIKTRRMKSRWGSCNASERKVTINTALADHPEACLRFVLMHELCHLIHPDHSKSFYDTLTRAMPDWEIYKKMLNRR